MLPQLRTDLTLNSMFYLSSPNKIIFGEIVFYIQKMNLERIFERMLQLKVYTHAIVWQTSHIIQISE